MADGTAAEIITVGSKVVYQNRWMRVREDAIIRQDGSPGIYGVVERPHFVIIVPVEPDGSVHLVEQYRYPVGGRFWEFPQGTWEGSPDADPLEVARGELREETGLVADEMIYAGHLFQGYGYSDQGGRVFLARGLRRAGVQLEHEEQGLITRQFSAAALVGMIRNDEIRDAISIAALGLLQLKGLYQP
jgi:ADP-ribose pyrophosphatase